MGRGMGDSPDRRIGAPTQDHRVTSILQLVEGLVGDPVAKAAYAADPDGYLERHGFGGLEEADLVEALGQAADTYILTDDRFGSSSASPRIPPATSPSRVRTASRPTSSRLPSVDWSTGCLRPNWPRWPPYAWPPRVWTRPAREPRDGPAGPPRPADRAPGPPVPRRRPPHRRPESFAGSTRSASPTSART
jgi:hypothetical protein